MSNRVIYLFLAVSILLCTCKKKEQPKPEILTGKWERVADFPGPYRYSAFAFSIGNKGYLIGGFVGTLVFRDLWEYDPSVNKWTRKADYPGREHTFTGFEINNKGYLYTGLPLYAPDDQLNSGFHEFYEYDPAADKWTKKADFAGEIRNNPVSFSVNGTGFIGLGMGKALGYVGAEIFNDFWSYNPLIDKWTRVTDFPGNGYQDISFVCNNKAYVGLGYNGDGGSANVFNNELLEYDPGFDKWTEKVSSYNGNKNGGAFVIGSKAYFGIGGNNDDPRTVNNIWTYTISNYISEYNATTNQWVKKADFPENDRYNLICFSINNAGYAGFGDDGINGIGNVSLQFWKFTP